MIENNTKPLDRPTYDKLRPRYQLFVDRYTVRFNARESALYAGYAETTAGQKGPEIAKREDVQKAIKETLEARRHELEQSRDSMRAVLQAKATVTLADLTKEAEHDRHDGKGKIMRLVPRLPAEIAPEYQACAGMVTVSREGNVVFNEGSQLKAAAELKQYMLWHQTLLDQGAPVVFNFEGLKRDEYRKPGDQGGPAASQEVIEGEKGS